jgi:hypothetical protein
MPIVSGCMTAAVIAVVDMGPTYWCCLVAVFCLDGTQHCTCWFGKWWQLMQASAAVHAGNCVATVMILVSFSHGLGSFV